MRAGDLRSRIEFYAPVAADDGYGNATSGYSATPNFTVAANLRPKLGGEQVLAGRLTGRNLVNVTVRQSDDTRTVGTDWRAVDARKDTIYNIRSIIDPDEGGVEAGAWLEMLCEVGVAGNG